ncbi:hypothetical protein, partial [Tenacibaculum agarivorans]|uniref:hypothetical protein n=1 Tax=Tenacibaculum agarivorans TaxID=1908389 RepID=UPI000AB47BCF
MKRIYFLILSILFTSCIADIDEGENGIYLDLYNYTNESYDEVVFHIGAIVDNTTFITTDSIIGKFPIIPFKDALEENIRKDLNGDSYSITPIDESEEYWRFGWNPDYDKIRELSNEYTFKIVLYNKGIIVREATFLNQRKSFDNFIMGSTPEILIKSDSLFFQ